MVEKNIPAPSDRVRGVKANIGAFVLAPIEQHASVKTAAPNGIILFMVINMRIWAEVPVPSEIGSTKLARPPEPWTNSGLAKRKSCALPVIRRRCSTGHRGIERTDRPNRVRAHSCAYGLGRGRATSPSPSQHRQAQWCPLRCAF